MRPVEVERLAGETHLVTVTLENSGAIPSRAGIAAIKKIGTPDFLELTGPGLTVVSSGRLTDRFRGTLERVENEPARLRLEEGIPGHGWGTWRFLVRGAGEATVIYRSEKGGQLETKVVVPRA